MSLFELNDVSVIYGKDQSSVHALDSINLAIEQGEIIAIVGKSGSGKSTLLNVLSGVEKTTKGSIIFEENDFTKLKEKQRARIRIQKFGFVFQAFYLISSLSVYDNICLPLAAEGKEVDKEYLSQIISKLELSDRLLHFPGMLSGGEKQRVALARALINKPQVLFADEPSGNLDSQNGDAVFELLFQLADKYRQTLIYVTHDNEKAQLADRVITIKDGKIISDEKK